VIFEIAAQVLHGRGFLTSARRCFPDRFRRRRREVHIMELRDWYELIRIQLKREEGQTMAEYGLLIALIAILLVAALVTFRTALTTTFTNISNAL
jgi:pilus assembly protein Flp/PilA